MMTQYTHVSLFVSSVSGDGGDGGIDIIGIYKKTPIIIQCKNHKRSIGKYLIVVC